MTGSSEVTSLSDPSNVRSWLASNHPKQLSMLDKFEIELRLGRLSTSSTGVARNPRGQSSQRATLSRLNTQNISPAGSSMYDSTDRRLVTTRTVELLKSLIGSTKWKNGGQLLTLLRGIGCELHAAGGFREPAIGNVVRRIMAAVREEVMNDATGATSTYGDDDNDNDDDAAADQDIEKNMSNLTLNENDKRIDDSNSNVGSGGDRRASTTKMSLSSMLWSHPQYLSSQHRQPSKHERSPSHSEGQFPTIDFDDIDSNADNATVLKLPEMYYVNRPFLKQSIMEAIQEIMTDLEDLHKNINEQSTSHIHNGEVILIYGKSKTVEKFLKAAHTKKRKFQVVVCEGAPHFGGHDMAKSLADYGIDTIVVNDSATFALMARVNKVLLPAHAVLANGGLIAPSGCNMVALAAKMNSVPVVTLTGMFKLCPMYPHEGQDTLNDLVSPSSVIDIVEMSNESMSNVELVNPVHDYLSPDLISLYVTNNGSFQPSYIYRLLAEYYHNDDWEPF